MHNWEFERRKCPLESYSWIICISDSSLLTIFIIIIDMIIIYTCTTLMIMYTCTTLIVIVPCHDPCDRTYVISSALRVQGQAAVLVKVRYNENQETITIGWCRLVTTLSHTHTTPTPPVATGQGCAHCSSHCCCCWCWRSLCWCACGATLPPHFLADQCQLSPAMRRSSTE